MNTKTWYITGASKGLGLSLVKALLKKGDTVAATSRNISAFDQSLLEDDKFLPLQVDLSNESAVKDSLDETSKKFGRIDVVVNNAGYGQYGYIEEVTEEEVEKQFQVNVFAVLNVLRAALPYVRESKGHIINITSKGGFHAGAGTGIYCASKYAVEGLTEALYFEMKPFGVSVTAVKPGGFRTNFLEKGSLIDTTNQLSVYKQFHLEEEQAREDYRGKQPGNPDSAALAIITVAEAENPPLHLFLGSDSYRSADKKFNEVTTDMENWKDVALSTDYKD